jgi:tetratricopeptide (TPR) repeat protein
MSKKSLMERRRRVILEKLSALERQAEERSFYEIKQQLEQIRGAIIQSDKKVPCETSSIMQFGKGVVDDARRPLDAESVFSAYEKAVNSLEGAFVAFRDPTQAALMASEDSRCQNAIELLASHSNFDSVIAEILKQQKRLKQEFLSHSAVDTEAKMRAAESQAIDNILGTLITVVHMSSAQDLNLLGKSEWAKGNFWAADVAWSKAIDLDDRPSYRTNRALVRTILGRRMRSECLGYFRPATELLEQAVEDATVVS